MFDIISGACQWATHSEQRKHLVPVVDPASGLLAFLQSQAGQTLRLRIGKVETNFPWDIRIDDVSLLVVGGD